MSVPLAPTPEATEGAARQRRTLIVATLVSPCAGICRRGQATGQGNGSAAAIVWVGRLGTEQYNSREHFFSFALSFWWS
jgi:hypothetical protein